MKLVVILYIRTQTKGTNYMHSTAVEQVASSLVRSALWKFYRCAGFLSNSLSPGSVRIADTYSICLKEESQGVARIDGRSYVRLLTALFELRNISEFVRPAFNSLGSLHLRNIAERRRHESNNIFCS
jgi:hypothetical protein